MCPGDVRWIWTSSHLVFSTKGLGDLLHVSRGGDGGGGNGGGAPQPSSRALFQPHDDDGAAACGAWGAGYCGAGEPERLNSASHERGDACRGGDGGGETGMPGEYIAPGESGGRGTSVLGRGAGDSGRHERTATVAACSSGTTCRRKRGRSWLKLLTP